MHLGYAKNVVRRIDEFFTQSFPAPAKLLEQITPLKTTVGKEDDDETRIVSTDKKAGRTGGIRFFETKGNARAGRQY